MAVWDAVAKIAGMPLHRLLANRYREGHFESKVFVYAAGGYYYPNKNLPALQDEMRSYLALGDRKSTRLNSSHGYISYAVFCLKKKKKYAASTDITSCISSTSFSCSLPRASLIATL